MIRHFVMLKFGAEVGAEALADLFRQLGELKDQIPGVVDFYAGVNVSVETDLIRGNRHAFWFDFVDEEARDAYLIDERHRAVGAQIVEHTEGGINGVTVVDMEF